MLAAHRRRQIVELVERQRLARASDLAERFGVTRMTINRDLEALSQDGLIDKVYGGAVAVQDEGPAPDKVTAGTPASTQGRRVAIVVPTDRFFFRAIVRGAQLTLSAAGIESTVIATGYRQPTEAAEIEEVDGAILTNSVTDLDRASAFPDIPTVVMERDLPPDRLQLPWSVATDAARGIRGAVRYLTELGHRRIALLTINRESLAQHMARAWSEQLAQSGLPAMPWVSSVHPMSAAEDQSSADAALTEILAATATAVICFNDLAAAMLARRAEERDCRVPQDLSVVGYGDEVSASLPVPMTVIAPQKLEIGRLAATCLIERMLDPSLPTRHVLVEPQLIVRGSTGPLK